MGFFTKENVSIKEVAEFLIELSSNIQLVDSLKKTNESISIGKEEYRELLVFSIIPIMITIFSVFNDTKKAQDIFDRFYTDLVCKNFKNSESQNEFNIFFEDRKNEYIEIYNTEKGENKFLSWSKFFCEKLFKKEQGSKNIINAVLADTILSNRLTIAKEFLEGISKRFNIIIN